jgi:hypothetical protein
MLETQQD